MRKRKVSTQTLVNCAMLVALQIVLARFASIQAWNLRIGFSFLALALAGMMYGPLAGGAVGAVSDVLGSTLFPTGPYFPGFTAVAFLNGAIYGLFLHKKQDIKHIVPAVLVQQVTCSLFLNSLNISLCYGSPFWPLVTTRLVQVAILTPIQIVILMAMVKVVHRVGSRAFST